MPIIYGKYDPSLGKPPVDEMIEQAEALIKKKEHTKSVENRYVLFMDILGFSNLIHNNDSEKIKQIYENVFIGNYSWAFSTAASKFHITHVSVPTFKGESEVVDLTQNKLELHIMSDSIIVWTLDDSIESLKDLCKFASSYLAVNLLQGLPLRGGLSKGEIINVDKKVNNIAQTCIVGKGVVNAYHAEQKQNWMGITIDETQISENELEVLLSDENTPVIKYKVPMKRYNKKEEKYEQYYEEKNVIDWTLFKDEYFKETDLKVLTDRFSEHNKPIEGIEDKIENTYNFLVKK